MTILITGSKGFLGSYLLSNLGQPQLLGTARDELDLTDEAKVTRFIEKIQPNAIIHTAALADVDACERNPGAAHQANVLATEYLARALQGSKAQLLYISTDQIFDGKKKFYSETDTPSPVNVYGKSKLEGEERVRKYLSSYKILRTNFYGLSTGSRPSFLNWCINTLKNQTPASLYEDVFYTPISIRDLTQTLSLMISSSQTGTYNVTGDERVSKADFFRKVAEVLRLPTDQYSFISYEQRPGSALRPTEMSLSNTKVKKDFSLSYESLSFTLKNLCTPS